MDFRILLVGDKPGTLEAVGKLEKHGHIVEQSNLYDIDIGELHGFDAILTEPELIDHEVLTRLSEVLSAPILELDKDFEYLDLRKPRDKRMKIGRMLIDPTEQTLHIDGESVHIPKSEFTLLDAMARRKGGTMTKANAMTALYGGMADSERDIKIIDVLICKMRDKLRPLGCETYIRTIWGQGYCLKVPDEKAPVSEVGFGLDDA